MKIADSKNLRIFTGNANPELAREIAEYMGVPLGSAYVGHFNNGETQVMIDESVRGKDVFIIQPTCQPVNDSMMELLIMIDACKRASAKMITAVVPYYAYARQDRKTRGREPISAKLVANLLTTAGASRIMTMDLHAGQIQGFFDIPVDHLVGVPILARYIAEKKLEDVVVVSPDLGGVTRARQLADRLSAPIAIIEKRRPMPGVAEVMNIIGNVEGKTAVIVDDIVDTAGSLVEGARALEKMGAKEVYACCTHGIMSDPATERVQNSCIKELIITNSIPLAEEKKIDKIKCLSVAEAFAEGIVCVYEKGSISKLFQK
ncbi:ribose-phosphate diphosphokinase [Anaerosinus gibii]|uniref:Ribose-phosphate pyrophosphokinase n=1 Tax=Selenobaculum gibii TaxID=3054208 RepID=A0A9Y2AIK7_9FIRM|nr:ribose-phosphate pyrophosphokinase [Selenobaculum gbiensis]WIW70947.1 ribose-phosphate pyrophosphokinase [Selenobaculum gbiensis]